jgi:hypothetical protein
VFLPLGDDGMMVVAGRFVVLPLVVGKLEQNWNWDFVLLGKRARGFVDALGMIIIGCYQLHHIVYLEFHF